MPDSFEAILKLHEDAFKATFDDSGKACLDAMAREWVTCLKAGGKLLFCGNGGSASDSQHIAAEFVGRFSMDRKALPAIALTTDTSILTAVANDYSYEDVFSRQVEALARPGDVLIAISTSGNSANVLRAARAAREKNVRVVALTGQSGGKLAEESDLCFRAATPVTSHVQEMHITALHAVSQVVENIFFGG